MKNKLVALDSNIFIYQFEAHPLYGPSTNQIFTQLAAGSFRAITSIISLIETLSYPSSPSHVEALEEKFRTLPNFTMYELTQEIALLASRIRRTYGFRLPDAVQLATAISQKAAIFITNDVRLQKCKEIKVVLLNNDSPKKH